MARGTRAPAGDPPVAPPTWTRPSPARARLRGILLTGTLLVVFTAFAIAWVLHAFVGVSNWSAALIIGTALAPTDAVAVATLNGKLPKSSITTLKAEALINDGTTLVLFALACTWRKGNRRPSGALPACSSSLS